MYHHPGVIAMQVSASLSFVLPLFVMGRILKDRLLNKVFLKMIFYLSLMDSLNGLTLAIGYAKSESPWCYAQGILTNYFGLAAFSWTCAIAYQVHLIVFQNRMEPRMMYVSLACWLGPLVVTLVPMSTSVEAWSDDSPGWCYYEPRSNMPHWTNAFWLFAGFYFWLCCVLFYLLVVVVSVSYKLFYQQAGTFSAGRVIVRRIIGYPIIVIVCWTVTMIFQISQGLGTNLTISPDGAAGILFTYFLPTFQGALTAIFFFTVNHDISAEAAEEKMKQSNLSSQQLGAPNSNFAHNRESDIEGNDDAVYGSSNPPEVVQRTTPRDNFGILLSKIRKNSGEENDSNDLPSLASSSHGSFVTAQSFASTQSNNRTLNIPIENSNNPMHGSGVAQSLTASMTTPLPSYDSRLSYVDNTFLWAESDRDYYW
jgi:hypothetical protein